MDPWSTGSLEMYIVKPQRSTGFSLRVLDQYHRFSFMARAASCGSTMDGTSPANTSPSGATVSGRRSCHRAGGTRKKKGPQHAPG